MGNALSLMPRFGLGTWHMGERPRQRAFEVDALRYGLELGVDLIDTAEMYGDGVAESIVGEAIAGRRDQVYIVSKCYPQNAGARSMPLACERSLKRLGIERIDCYLLHWRGRIPLAQTVEAFESLVHAGKIARWGVSNFDVDDIGDLLAIPGGERCATNQVLYSLEARAAEWKLLDLCRRHRMSMMAYSPLGQGDLLAHPKLVALAKARAMTPAQLALAFVLAQPDTIAIPKSANRAHVRENVTALSIELDSATRAALDGIFRPPVGPAHLSMR